MAFRLEVICVCVLQCDVTGVKQSKMNLQNKMKLVLLFCCGSEIFQSHQYHTVQLLLQKTVRRRFLKSFYNSAINVTHTTFISRTMRYLISFLMMPLNGESLELKYSTISQGLSWINIFIDSKRLLNDNFKCVVNKTDSLLFIARLNKSLAVCPGVLL